MKGNYQTFTAIPAGWTRVVNDELDAQRDTPLKWSGYVDPPVIGAKVKINFNGLGTGTVIGYFVEYNWFGCLVTLDKNPRWRKSQLGGNPPAHIFGIDLDPPKTRFNKKVKT